MNLSDLPEHKRTREWIESEIAHEAEEGVHTYHDCKCGRGACRSSRCVQCWREVLKHAPQVREEDSEPELTTQHVENLRRWMRQIRDDHRSGKPVTVFEYAALLLWEDWQRRRKVGNSGQ